MLRILPIVPNPTQRNDTQGSGAYGANRGTRLHMGEDILVYGGQVLNSPISGTIQNYGYAYANDPIYRAFDVVGEDYTFRIMYATLDVPVGMYVSAGQPIATAQTISTKYGSDMKDHIHVEVFQNGQRIPPAPFIYISPGEDADSTQTASIGYSYIFIIAILLLLLAIVFGIYLL